MLTDFPSILPCFIYRVSHFKELILAKQGFLSGYSVGGLACGTTEYYY